MFSVIISEKGGAERRESFDRTEINVGRVQGNDLMLPKGNVSKRHARLLYRDGRFIVTDLKSTNGTYVNGRKIAQATIVREGDKIYIGDFVLRIESSSAAGVPAPTGAPMVTDEPPPPDLSAPPSPLPMGAPPPEATRGQGYAAPPPYPEGQTPIPPARTVGSDAPSSQPASSVDKALRSPRGPRVEPKGEVISHFPLENDPDESLLYALPGPPRVPGQHPGLRADEPRYTPDPGQHPGLRADEPHYAPGPSPARPPAPQPLPQAPQPQPKPVAPAPRPVPSPPFEPLRALIGTTVPSAGVPPPPAMVPAHPPLVAAPPPLGPAPPPLIPLAPAPPALVPASPPPPVERGTSPSTGMASALGLSPPVGTAISSGPALTPQSPVAGAGRLAMPPARLEPESIEPSRVLAYRTALARLIEKVGEVVDLRPLEGGGASDEATASRLERAIAEQAAAMRAAEELRPDIDVDAFALGARRELLEYGPLTVLLNDEDVSEIHVTRHDYVLAMHGRRQVPTEVGFSSERSLARAIRRLCLSAGRPLAQGEMFVERRLARGARLFAVLPTAPDQGHMLVIRKPQRADLTLEDLVRSGTISRAMAALLGQCIEGRANILVTGTAAAGATALLGALAAAGSTTDRVVVLQEDDELVFNQPHTVSILLGDAPEDAARAVQAAARLRPDRLVVGAFAGRVAAEVVDAMGDGVDGVLAASRASTLRQAVARLTADLAATRLGLTVDVAREWLASSFDLAIEIARLSDGRHRVLRVAELGVDGARVAIRDVFTFAIERTAAGGAIEGSFHPTGFIPGIVEDLAARGVTIDPSLFKRHAGSRP